QGAGGTPRSLAVAALIALSSATKWCAKPPPPHIIPPLTHTSRLPDGAAPGPRSEWNGTRSGRMANEKVDGRELSWRGLFPWTELFRGFQLALDLNKLLLAAAGIPVMAFGWCLLPLL